MLLVFWLGAAAAAVALEIITIKVLLVSQRLEITIPEHHPFLVEEVEVAEEEAISSAKTIPMPPQSLARTPPVPRASLAAPIPVAAVEVTTLEEITILIRIRVRLEVEVEALAPTIVRAPCSLAVEPPQSLVDQIIV